MGVSGSTLGIDHWQHRYGRISCTWSGWTAGGQARGCDAVKTGGPFKVMVVDDHPVFGEALALAIEGTGEMTCVGTALDVDQAVGLADELEPDVAVVDVQLNGTDGVAGTRRLLDRHPGMQVLVLTGLPLSNSLIRDVAKSGASGLLPKSASLSEVVDTIPSLRAHSFAMDRQCLVSLCETGEQTEPAQGSRGTSLLTKREQDILSLLVSGVDLQSAALRLGITVNTARGYVKNLYRKLGVHNQLELLAVARERGLLEAAE
jgi:SARP family transcriptional regulator, regulator of embCAB operon